MPRFSSVSVFSQACGKEWVEAREREAGLLAGPGPVSAAQMRHEHDTDRIMVMEMGEGGF